MPYNRYLNGIIRQPHFQADVVGNDELTAAHPKHLIFKYDFATDGGSQGSISLKDNNGVAQQIPAGAIITNSYIEVETAITSAGSATVAFGLLGNTDAFKAATAKGTLSANYVVAGANDLPLRTAVPIDVQATIAVADLDGGLFRIFVEYIEGGF